MLVLLSGLTVQKQKNKLEPSNALSIPGSRASDRNLGFGFSSSENNSLNPKP